MLLYSSDGCLQSKMSFSVTFWLLHIDSYVSSYIISENDFKPTVTPFETICFDNLVVFVRILKIFQAYPLNIQLSTPHFGSLISNHCKQNIRFNSFASIDNKLNIWWLVDPKRELSFILYFVQWECLAVLLIISIVHLTMNLKSTNP